MLQARSELRAALLVLCAGALVAAWVPGAAAAPARDRAPAQAAEGSLVIAAEEEPATADWIDAAAGSSWGVWILGIQTLPQAFTITPRGDYEPSPVLAGEPELNPGPPMTVTYRINPAAVWSDGVPITSADFEYLWKQITTGRDIYDTTGYTEIEQIDTTDPKTAVVTFKEPYAAWRDLFGGFYFLLPSHLLEGKNRHAAMKDGYAFSGGPWKLEGGKRGWKKGKSITLVPNERYWGERPRIGKVTFQFITETSAEIEAVKTGQVSAAYPLPQTGILDEIGEESNLRYDVGSGNTYEALWFNTSKFPLNRRAVREALAYSTDRRSIVQQLVVPSVGEGEVLQSFNVPTFPRYYEPVFERYSFDIGRVNQLMEADGWKRNSRGIWERNGREARLEINTTADNRLREQTEQIIQSQWEEAGFALEPRNAQPNVLFGRWAPEGVFTVGLFAAVGTPDPGLCFLFCSENIPTKRNGFTGQNWTRISSPAIDGPLEAQDQTLDVAARAELVRQGQAALAEALPGLPLYQLPTLFVWDAEEIEGPLQDNPTMGPFANMNLWSLRGS